MEQLAEEEAEVADWIQVERAKASMESTGRSRSSSEDSGKRPDFDGGEGASSSSSRMSKRRRGQRRSQRRHENSPNLEIPSTIVEEASRDDDEPLEKRSREEETIDDGMLFPFPFSFLFFHECFCFDLLLSFFWQKTIVDDA